MISIVFEVREAQICGFRASGHANAASYGSDVVCAGVSSILIGACNGLDLLAPDQCDFLSVDNPLIVKVRKSSESLQNLLEFLYIQLAVMQEAYPKRIHLKKKEV